MLQVMIPSNLHTVFAFFPVNVKHVYPALTIHCYKVEPIGLAGVVGQVFEEHNLEHWSLSHVAMDFFPSMVVHKKVVIIVGSDC